MASSSSRIDSDTEGSNQITIQHTIRKDRLNRLAYESIRRRIATGLRTSINRGLQGTYVFIKDIIPSVGFEEAQRIINNYQNYTESQKTSTFILGWHPEKEKGHYHLYHICNYNQSNCRCQYLRGINIKRRRHTDITSSYPIEEKYINNILNYLLEEPRQLVHIQIGSISYEQEIHQLADLGSSISTGRLSRERTMEMCEYESEDGSRSTRLSTIGPNFEEIAGIERFINQGFTDISWNDNNSNSTKRKIKLQYYLIQNLLRLLTIPLESGCQVSQWLDNPILSIYDSKNVEYQLAVSTLNRMTNNLTFDQLYRLHTTPGCLGIYSARTENHYYSIEQSIEYCEQLLFHQYTTEENVKQFLIRLYNITEKQIPKKNSMFILGMFCLQAFFKIKY